MSDDVQLTTVNKNLAYLSQQIETLQRNNTASVASLASLLGDILKEMQDQHRTLYEILKAVDRE